MKIAVVILALVAMVASQRVRVANYPEVVQLVDYNPELAEDDGSDEEVYVVDNNYPSQLNVVDNPPLPYDPDNFVLDPSFGRPGSSIDPGFGRPGDYPENGADLMHKEPAYIDPPGANYYPKKYDNPTWRGGK